MPANGPCGPVNGAIPRSGFGVTPAGAPTGSSLAITLLALVFRSRLVTVFAPASTTYNWPSRTRMPCGSCRPSSTVSGAEPLSLITRPAADSETNTEPSGALATPSGFLSPDASTSTLPDLTDNTRPAPSSATTTAPSAATATPYG